MQGLALELLRKVPPRIGMRAIELFKDSEIGTREYRPGHYSNCVGTALYVVGHPKVEIPMNIPWEDFERILEEEFTEDKIPGSIFLMRNRERKYNHCGVFLGEHENLQLIFHQLGHAKRFNWEWIKLHPDFTAEGYYKISFYSLKKN